MATKQSVKAFDTAEFTPAEKAEELKICVDALQAATASIATGIDDGLVTGDQVYNLLFVIVTRLKERCM